MKFEGDLSKFFPPDLLIFLANLGKEGVLTVTNNKKFISISFKNGGITNAHSNDSDEKLLKILYLNKYINNENYKQINQARKETGIAVLQILEKLELLSFNKIKGIIVDCIKEVIFRFFLLKNGEFRFSNIQVEIDNFNTSLTPHAIAIEIASQIDDWQEIERRLTSFDRKVTRSDKNQKNDQIVNNEKILFSIIREGKTIRELINQSPMLSYTALKTIEKAINQKRLILHQPEKQTDIDSALSKSEELFYEYKTAFKKILNTQNSVEKIKVLIGFCKHHFDQTFVISMTKNTLIRCFVFFKDRHNSLKCRQFHNIKCNIDDDPVFARAYSSGFSFFGKNFPVKIVKNIIEIPLNGDCAVIPLGKKDDRVNLIYAVSTGTVPEIGSFHYLELLSWLINPEIENPEGIKMPEKLKTKKQPVARHLSGSLMEKIDNKKVFLAEIIDDLPPMPHLASKMLQILSDPESSVDDLIAVLGQDQSMMATIIKVSNSALYRTGGEISTLNNAVTRLGFKTIRSLVLTAATHSLFPKNNAKLGVMSQTLWQHSKECGLASRRTAETVGYHDPEEAFVGGLLHDIGKLTILLKFTDNYNQIVKIQNSEALSSVESEKKILGFDHTEAGGRLMDKWKIPANLSACVKFHHSSNKNEQFSTLINIVAMGDCLSNLHGIRFYETKTDNSKRLNTIIKELNMSKEDIESLRELVIDDFKQSDIFD